MDYSDHKLWRNISQILRPKTQKIEHLSQLNAESKVPGNSVPRPTYTDIILRLTLRRLMSYIYGAPILDVSRSHTTTQHSR